MKFACIHYPLRPTRTRQIPTAIVWRTRCSTTCQRAAISAKTSATSHAAPMQTSPTRTSALEGSRIRGALARSASVSRSDLRPFVSESHVDPAGIAGSTGELRLEPPDVARQQLRGRGGEQPGLQRVAMLV
jgi:hypothetical protein